LPTPPGAGGIAKPSGAVGGLTILDWAGFKAAVSWTFDDSQPSQIAHYAELQAVGVPMTFYISTGNSTEAGYDAAFSQAIQDGHEIGNHTVHHCNATTPLSGCSFGTPAAGATVTDELNQCNAYITSHYTQGAVWTGASPFGDTGYDTAASSIFFVYRGVGGGTIGANDTTDPFNLPIHLAASGETAASFDTATDQAQSAGRWLIFLIHTILPTTANWFNPVQITDVTGGMSHGQGLGNVWMATVANVGAYWRAQKIVSSAAPSTSAGTTTWTWALPAHFPSGKFLRVTVTGGTLSQRGQTLAWNAHGYYEVALDAGSLTLGP
jgi:peptidoglycan/xylan/chitin deacetylase (PgdA/CDA1 family)